MFIFHSRHEVLSVCVYRGRAMIATMTPKMATPDNIPVTVVGFCFIPSPGIPSRIRSPPPLPATPPVAVVAAVPQPPLALAASSSASSAFFFATCSSITSGNSFRNVAFRWLFAMDSAASRRFSDCVVLTLPVVGVVSYMNDTSPDNMLDTDHIGFHDSG